MPATSKRVKVEVEGTGSRLVPVGTILADLVKEVRPQTWQDVLAARVDNDLRELTYTIHRNCRISFLGLETEDGHRIYQRSLTLVLVRAAREVLPGCRVTIEHSLSNGLYGEIHFQQPLAEKNIKAIEKRMEEIIAANEPIVKLEVSRDEAMALFEKDGQMDKVHLLRYRKSPTVKIYRCGWYHDYFYGYMVPSTGYLTRFKLRFYLPGFILQIPHPDSPHVIPEYREQPKLAHIYWEAEKWGKVLKVADVASLNDVIESGGSGDLIRVAEALHEKKIAQIADKVAEKRHELRIILIAGPSSSGKTTFAQRLSIQLRVNGLRPVAISLDDYFLEREKTPKNEQGEYDFESIEAIDLPFFNEQLTDLIQGEEVLLPTFNFKKGKREFTGKKLRVSPDQPIIIEGIHGLNERLTAAIPKGNKFKIYISALTQLNIDDHNRIPTTDVRMLRRIVRDHRFRGHSALETIRHWPSVRRGEERNIFPFQEDADVMFNSALVYELAVLKPHAEPLLRAIDRSVYEYSEAKRLLKFLSYFLPLDARDIPATSIIREFIGGSCFH